MIIFRFEMLDKETKQRMLGALHGGGLVMFVLAQEQEVLTQLILGECGRVALEMLSQFADVAEVFLFGRLAKIFKLDVLLELSDRRIVCNMHRPGRMPSCEDNFPANP